MIKRISLIIILNLLIISLIPAISYADELKVTYSPDEIRVGSETSTLQVLRVSPSDTSGLHSLFLTLIGDYNPVVKDYTYQSTQGYTSHSIEITPDWSWIMTAALFIIVVYCFLRIVGGLICG